MKRRAAVLVAVAFVGVVAVGALCNYVFVQRHLSSVVHADPRSNGITVFAHYKFFVLPRSVVFDLRRVSGESSPADVSRVLLQFAEALKDNMLTDVTLSYRGSPKFVLKGEYFHTLGIEYGTQNPVYTMRTFPENVYKLDGSPAFGTWTGGWLGVLGKQMEDFNEFHKQSGTSLTWHKMAANQALQPTRNKPRAAELVR
jgi:hypothetical protein